MLNDSIDPRCVWDGLFLTAGELLMRQPGIVGIHCVTSANALHFGYQTSANDETRRLLMLQAAAFLPMFRQAMAGRGRLPEAVESYRHAVAFATTDAAFAIRLVMALRRLGRHDEAHAACKAALHAYP